MCLTDENAGFLIIEVMHVHTFVRKLVLLNNWCAFYYMYTWFGHEFLFLFLWDSVILVLKVFRLVTFIVFVLNFLFEWLFKCSNWEMKFLLFFFYFYFFKTLIHSLFYWFSGWVKWAYGRFKVYSVGNDFVWLLILAYTWKIKFSYFLSVELDTAHLKSQFIDQNLHKQFSFLPNPRQESQNQTLSNYTLKYFFIKSAL